MYKDILTDWEGALARLDASMRVMIAPSCGEPQALVKALVERAERFKGLQLMSGLLLSDYKFLDERYKDNFHYLTTHVMPPVRGPLEQGRADYVSVRHFHIPRVFGRGGPLEADAILVQVTPPDNEGMVSLGPSTSYPLSLARQAKIVIAQVNSKVPYTLGDSRLPVSQITAAVEWDEELVEYRAPRVTEVETKIAEHVLPLVPKGAALQIGIGNVPEAVLGLLPGDMDIKIFGMGVDSMAKLCESGVITGPICSIELMGTRRLWDFARNNPRVQMQVSEEGHNPDLLGTQAKFTSLNSAVEIDLSGQVNAESVGQKQISGLGGQFDFVEASIRSEGGRNIFAFPSTSGGDGKFSRIVARLGAGAKVTTPRYMVNYVVTEYGVADLWGKTVRERAEALIKIAHPKFQAELEEAVRKVDSR